MSNIQSVERAFAVLHALASGPAGVSDIAERTNLPKSTVSRLLTTLVGVGAAERNDLIGIYGLGTAIVDLAASASPGSNLVTVTRPFLQQLVDDTGEAAGVSMLDGNQVWYYDQIDGDHEVQVRDWTGEAVDFHVVSSGLVLAAHLKRADRDALLADTLNTWTEHSMTDIEEIRARLTAIRTRGYAWTLEEMSDGLNSVAAPVTNAAGTVVAAIHAHGPSYRFPDEGAADDVAAAVVTTARQVSDRLAGRMSDDHEAVAG
ncbi:MAG: IclR family transcriptional regulator [Ilumatobacter sp.]